MPTTASNAESHRNFTTSEQVPLAKALVRLKDSVKALSNSITFTTAQTTQVIACMESLEPVEPLHWLYHQKVYPRLYWKNREQNNEVAAVGIADSFSATEADNNKSTFTAFQTLCNERASSARYFGGFRFNCAEVSDAHWNHFPPFFFFLPLITIERLPDHRYTLTANLFLASGDNVSEKIKQLISFIEQLNSRIDSTAISSSSLPFVEEIIRTPHKALWKESCQKALTAFENGELEKIMLARQTTLRFTSTFSPLLFLLRYPYPNNAIYRFYFEPAPNQAFFSFTPERLFRRNHNVVETEALAGTCSKELLNATDQHASQALLASEKDVREHNYVREMIYQELLPICSSIDMEDEVQVLQLQRLAHLYTRCSALLKEDGIATSDILTQLHPTPAVGGVPKEEIVNHISRLEPFTRGWYAAPVGWADSNHAEFAVGIRSGLVTGNEAHLFSGAGLVKGSDPDAEWEEIEQKIGDLLSITRMKP